MAETAINKLIGLAGEVINESHPNELFYGRAGKVAWRLYFRIY